MRVLTASIITALALTTTAQAYAGNGDLIIKGNTSIGTTTPISPLTVGNPLYSGVFPTLNGNKINISDINTATDSSNSASLHVVTQVNPATNSLNVLSGQLTETIIPASSTFSMNSITGNQTRVENLGTGTVASQYGSYTQAYNSSIGTVDTLYGTWSQALNNSTGSTTSSFGLRGSANNIGGGTNTNSYGSYGMSITFGTSRTDNQYGMYGFSNNASTATMTNSFGAASRVWNKNGTIINAYGMAIGDSLIPGIGYSTGNIVNGYGLYIGGIQANNKWSIYSTDATAPSYFAGNVGIGTTIPAFALDVQGQVASNGVVLTSDAKFKKNLLSISNPLDKVLNLNGLSYEWKTDEYKEKNFPDGRHYGVVAQEIEKVLPEVVITDAKGEKSVAYSEIIPVLIEAIKEQQNIIKSQDRRISDLEGITNKLNK
jgi:hypothetical protein